MSRTHGEDWWLKRRGKLTSSVIHIVVAGTTRGWNGLLKRLRTEATMEAPIEWDVEPRALEWGKRYEPEAIANFEFDHLVDVEYPGFIVHPRMPLFGGTPDGHTKRPEKGRLQQRTIEVKCPLDQERHRWVMMRQQVPPEYVCQLQANMLLAGHSEGFFISYDPRVEVPAYRLVVVQVERDEKLWRVIEERAAQFCELLATGKDAVVEKTLTVPQFFRS